MKEAADLFGENQREEVEMDKRLAQTGKRLLKEAGRMRAQTEQEGPRAGRGVGQGRGSKAARQVIRPAAAGGR